MLSASGRFVGFVAALTVAVQPYSAVVLGGTGTRGLLLSLLPCIREARFSSTRRVSNSQGPGLTSAFGA